MNQVNRVRVLVGGIVGGVISFVIMGLANHVFLNNDWMSFMGAASALMSHPMTPKESMTFWFISSLVQGIVGVSIYTAYRARCGPGPKTALWTGLVVWLLVFTTEMFNSKAIGILPERIVCGEWLSGLAATLVGIFVGCAIYKE